MGNITKKASITLNFVRHNLKYCPKQCKEVAYLASVRSSAEYGCVVWDPRTNKEKDKNKIERINRRAARMVTNDYGLCSSVTAMLTQLGWPTLEQRRENQRLTTMYKVIHGLVAVPATQLIPADSRTTTKKKKKKKISHKH